MAEVSCKLNSLPPISENSLPRLHLINKCLQSFNLLQYSSRLLKFLIVRDIFYISHFRGIYLCTVFWNREVSRTVYMFKAAIIKIPQPLSELVNCIGQKASAFIWQMWFLGTSFTSKSCTDQLLNSLLIICYATTRTLRCWPHILRKKIPQPKRSGMLSWSKSS